MKTLDEKRNKIFDYYLTRDKNYLCSFIMSLFTPEDIKEEYKRLPKNFK